MRLMTRRAARRVRPSALAPVPWRLWEPRRDPEMCESTSCPVCRPLPEGYPGGTAMRWKPGHWEGPVPLPGQGQEDRRG